MTFSHPTNRPGEVESPYFVTEFPGLGPRRGFKRRRSVYQYSTGSTSSIAGARDTPKRSHNILTSLCPPATFNSFHPLHTTINPPPALPASTPLPSTITYILPSIPRIPPSIPLLPSIIPGRSREASVNCGAPYHTRHTGAQHLTVREGRRTLLRHPLIFDRQTDRPFVSPAIHALLFGSVSIREARIPLTSPRPKTSRRRSRGKLLRVVARSSTGEGRVASVTAKVALSSHGVVAKSQVELGGGRKK